MKNLHKMSCWGLFSSSSRHISSQNRYFLVRSYALAATSEKPSLNVEDDEFRVLNFLKKRERFQRKEFKRAPIAPIRAQQMPVNQKWGDVWPGPRTYHPACVPLPLNQGYTPYKQAPPGSFANAELMKIPNFLHLTPPAIAAHCEAVKKFCTPWPAGLDDDEKCEKHFPLEVVTSDYCHSGPSIRNELSRIATIQLKLKDIPLDSHAKDKLLRLVGDRYDENTDIITITTDRCPMRKQNLDYAMYLLTAIYHESWTIEDWEKEKMEADMEVYIWDNNPSKEALVRWLNYGSDTKETVDGLDLSKVHGGEEYKEAVSELMNIGEDDYQLNKYKESVKKILGLGNDELPIDNANKA